MISDVWLWQLKLLLRRLSRDNVVSDSSQYRTKCSTVLDSMEERIRLMETIRHTQRRQQHAEGTAQMELFDHLYHLVHDFRFLLQLAYQVDNFIGTVLSRGGDSAHSCNSRLLEFMLCSLGEHDDKPFLELRDGLRGLQSWHDDVTNSSAMWENTLTQTIRCHLGWAIHQSMENLKSALLVSALAEPVDFVTLETETRRRMTILNT